VSAIIFEQPLTERLRLFLRVEQLANQLEYFRELEHPQESSAALMAMVELFTLFERNDIKNDLCKEMERHSQSLSRLQGHEDINTNQLSQILNELQQYIRLLQQQGNRVAQVLRGDELLNSIRQRLAIPGATCSFDTPAYYFWLHTPIQERQARFNHWLEAFTPLSEALTLLLHLTRHRNYFQPEVAYQGFYQKNLESNVYCPLIQVKLNANLGVYPEMSGGKFRASIRFWQFMPLSERSQACQGDIPFELRCCII
jgi:cell division protein ZapD